MIGVSRRQFFNRATVTLDERRHRRLLGGVDGRLPVADRHRRFRRQGGARQARRHQGGDRHRRRVRLLPRGPHLGHRLPGRGPGEGRGGLRRAAADRHARTASSPSTRSAHTSAAACHRAPPANGSSAAATARSTTRSARRRAARHLAGWTGSSSRSRPAVTSLSTPAIRCSGRRSAPTPPARRPKVRTASPAQEGIDGRTGHDVDRLDPGHHSRRRLAGLPLPQHALVAPGGGLGDRAGPQPQALLRRRDARRTAPRNGAAARRAAARRDRHRPASLLGARAEPSGRRPARRRSRSSPRGARTTSRRPPTAASTAPDVMAG